MSRQFVAEHPEIEAKWWQESNTLVLLETEDLEALEQEAKAKNISCVRFVEPDWHPDGVLTALAIGPDGRKITSRLPSAFKKKSV